jgi:hypothetical protein
MTLELGFRPETGRVGIGRLSEEALAGFAGFLIRFRPSDGVSGVTFV